MLDFTFCPSWDKVLPPKTNKHTSMNVIKDTCTANKLNFQDFLKHVIITGFNLFDSDDSLYGLFNALRMSHNTISPFIATHDYRLKIRQAKVNGEISADISPIYHLGPDFVEQYQTQNGKALADEAIVGLITQANSNNNSRKTYSLGIDAGLAFKNSKISHTKTIKLVISESSDGLFICLSCESQTTSKTLSWKTLDIQHSTAANKHSSKKANA